MNSTMQACTCAVDPGMADSMYFEDELQCVTPRYLWALWATPGFYRPLLRISFSF